MHNCKSLKIDIPLYIDSIQDSEILYVIGNGFDLAHDIESSYYDFEDWCNIHNLNTEMFEMFFHNGDQSFWKDIEESLGNYDYKEIHEELGPDEDFDPDHSLSSYAIYADTSTHLIGFITDLFEHYFVDWVNSIEISFAEQCFQLRLGAKFLSFNYTETLESIYGVPEKQVCHIHGCRLNSADKYIFGHKNPLQPDTVYDDSVEPYIEESYFSIVEHMLKLKKPVEEQISIHHQFFSSLQNIKLVCVIGHSLSEIDMPYFHYLLEVVQKRPAFVFTSYNDADRKNIVAFVNSNHITKYSILDLTENSEATNCRRQIRYTSVP